MDDHLSNLGFTQIEIEQWENSSASKLYPILKGGLYHRTSVTNYFSIKKDGYIYPNKGQFQFTYPQSEYYYGYSNGLICLFDFAVPTLKECIITFDSWEQFFFDQHPVTIVFKLNREDLSDKLIPNSAAPKNRPNYKGHIHYVESWYPEPISFSSIEGFCIPCYLEGELKVVFFEKSIINEFEKVLNILKKENTEQ